MGGVEEEKGVVSLRREIGRAESTCGQDRHSLFSYIDVIVQYLAGASMPNC